jgi:hypothetical protein
MPVRQPALMPPTSSAPVKIPEEQETLFREILTLFEQQHVPYAVAGAFASQAVAPFTTWPLRCFRLGNQLPTIEYSTSNCDAIPGFSQRHPSWNDAPAGWQLAVSRLGA